MAKNKSYVRDTQHFIQRINEIEPLPEGAIIATLDVTSLYTNIPNYDGIMYVCQALSKDPDPHVNCHYLLRLLGKVLTRNYFTFNGKLYLQVGVQPWAHRLHPHMLIHSWGDMKQNC
jgi:hypothetical protein